MCDQALTDGKASGERLLIVIELVEDVDEDTYSSERSMAQGSRMIITSRSEKIVRFGITDALRLVMIITDEITVLFVDL